MKVKNAAAEPSAREARYKHMFLLLISLQGCFLRDGSEWIVVISELLKGILDHIHMCTIRIRIN